LPNSVNIVRQWLQNLDAFVLVAIAFGEDEGMQLFVGYGECDRWFVGSKGTIAVWGKNAIAFSEN
jgi:hypothetical protein